MPCSHILLKYLRSGSQMICSAIFHLVPPDVNDGEHKWVFSSATEQAGTGGLGAYYFPPVGRVTRLNNKSMNPFWSDWRQTCAFGSPFTGLVDPLSSTSMRRGFAGQRSGWMAWVTATGSKSVGSGEWLSVW